MKVHFIFERSTKRMHRFQEDSDNPVIGTLYVSKTVFGNKEPKELTITLEV